MAKSTSSSGPVTAYLVAYNLASMASWAWILYRTALVFLQTGDHTQVYAQVGWPLTVVQTFMLLDVVHSALGLVRSPVLTNLVQVASRIIIMWEPLQWFKAPEATTSWFLTIMICAWGITEVVRYGYYAANLLGFQPRLLTWARYTFFYVLYPLGASSEAAIIYYSLDAARDVSSILYGIAVVEILLYFPLFPQMYLYMIKQRSKVLGGSKPVKRTRAHSTPIKKKI
ncbi:hypothetical protein IWQ60_003129 [Tieghemiomyces parasiticus]|uniref:Very-long-chain (3R)-3-hydroxyacyl-CoA dehydratase n=1 Tax=Tieghemiomyces parasiticus TaxID=78921 RepID=A0A9W8AA54_9FUNG|nr:hypothetical protein IWQ60_003129 [Tieghemiomyces parasiticus]